MIGTNGGSLMNRILLAALALAAPAAAQAQTVAMEPGAPVKRIEAPITAGTPVVLRSMVTTTALRTGSVVPFELVKPIVVEGRTIVPAGAAATAVVSNVEAATKSRPGRVTGRLQSLQYGATTVRLIGGFEGTGAAEPTVPMGLTINGYVDENVPAYLPPVPTKPIPVPPPVRMAGIETAPIIATRVDHGPTVVTTTVERDTAIVAVPDRPVRAVPTLPKRPVVVETAKVTTTTVTPVTVAAKPLYGETRSLTTQTRRIEPKKPTVIRSKVTTRDVTVESGGTTTHYVY